MRRRWHGKRGLWRVKNQEFSAGARTRRDLMAADPTGSGFETAGSGSSSEDGGMGGVLAGVGIAVVASVGINIGNNMQALGLKMGAKVECCKKQGGGEPEQPANAS